MNTRIIKAVALLVIASVITVRAATPTFKNRAQKKIIVTIEYQDNQCPPVQFYMGNQETKQVPSGTCIITRITARIDPQTLQDKSKYMPTSEFIDHESGNVRYDFDLPQQQSLLTIAKNV